METMLGESLSGEWDTVVPVEPALVFDDEVHLGSTLAKLNTLRKESQLCDVFLQVGRNNFAAHRAVLACTSGHLMELFTEDEGNARTHFKLPNVDTDAFEILVNYAYTSRLEVPKEMVITVYKTATLLKIPRAAEACSEYLAGNLTLQNCLAIRGFANSTCHAELTEATDDFIQEHMSELVESPAFSTLPSMKVDIMGVDEDELRASGEGSVAQLVVTWLEGALGEQKFQTFTENPHVLYLTEENELRDCLTLHDDDVSRQSDAERELAGKLHHSEVVQDYVKLSRRLPLTLPRSLSTTPSSLVGQTIEHRQMGLKTKRPWPEELVTTTHMEQYAKGTLDDNKRRTIPAVKGSKVNQRSHPTQNSNLTKGRRQSSLEKLSTIHQEWKLIATYMVKASSCVCVAMLEDRLTAIHLKFRPYPREDEIQEQLGGTRSGAQSPVNSPRPAVSAPEKHVSLTPLASMNQGRCGAGTAVVVGHILVVGGYDRGECLDSMECYNPATNTWATLPGMSSARGRFDIAQIDNKLYACGGSNGSADLKSAEVYDWDSGQWNKLPDMKYERSSPGVAALNKKVYVIGGWSGCAGLRKCEVYDPATSVWTEIAPMNSGRSQAAVCTFDGKIVAVGGCDAWMCTNTVEMYDPQTDEWTNLPPMISHRRGAGITVFDGRLYVVGGSDGQSSLTCVETFDFDSMAWSPGPSIGMARASVGVAVAGERLYAVGGFSGKHFLDSIECLGRDRREWCGFAPRIASSPSDSSADSDTDSNLGSEAGDGQVIKKSDLKLKRENGPKENGVKLKRENEPKENGARFPKSGAKLNGLNKKVNGASEEAPSCQDTYTECVPPEATNGHPALSVNGYS